MAATEAEIQAVAKAVRDVAKALKAANAIMTQTLDANSAQAIDWTLQPAKDALEEHPTTPTSYTAAEISNAIGSFATFGSAFWDAGHSSNMELLLGETPIV